MSKYTRIIPFLLTRRRKRRIEVAERKGARMSEYIDKEEAIKEAKAWSMYYKDDLVSRLERLPSIEVKQGKWQITSAYPHIVYCSECHKRYAQTNWAVWDDKDYPLPKNYCPFCGAKMEGIDG